MADVYLVFATSRHLPKAAWQGRRLRTDPADFQRFLCGEKRVDLRRSGQSLPSHEQACSDRLLSQAQIRRLAL